MDKELLTESLVLVDGQEEALTPRFYEILFTRYPQVRPMFSADIAPQAKMLRSAVLAVLDNLDDSVWLTDTLGALGAKHSGWGVTPPMYDAVAECMIAAMEELGGSAWTPAMTAEWTGALGAVASLMLAGAEGVAEPDAEGVA
ncbi:globin domain-containing protein [Nocardioides sp. Kera G14]|uniref:globin domain-containing protein n=1 Tax=Nocardioides sp. Kera G14 TaxID=2884264 RepID=UPI001D12DAB0|nr:globin domain-containing protein [Nocardioides sp. Kera G14]UDY23799.1 globin domain-containing protein [Nocardioides sp. Kera G14]